MGLSSLTPEIAFAMQGTDSIAIRAGTIIARFVTAMVTVDDPLFRDLMTAHQAIWVAPLGGWLVNPDDAVSAFREAGFAEYRREIVRSRDESPLGGLWQGFDHASGRIACLLWVNHVNAGRALVVVEVDGAPLRGPDDEGGEPVGELDDALLRRHRRHEGPGRDRPPARHYFT